MQLYYLCLFICSTALTRYTKQTIYTKSIFQPAPQMFTDVAEVPDPKRTLVTLLLFGRCCEFSERLEGSHDTACSLWGHGS